ncbi:MAG: adenine phosphoribosyltransferase [Spirochaetes bacterium]|nr:adenine phosphoribosyltransferase [Spirochaetota bacterium]
MEDLSQYIRDVKDYPKEGIVFKDITTLWKKGDAFKKSLDILIEKYKGKGIDKVVAAEARGFIIGAPLAYGLRAGFVPVRKVGKLPADVIKASYELEYGTDTLTMHKDAIEAGEKILIADDLIATGGTCRAIAELVEQLGGKIISFAFLVELSFLKGREKIKDYDFFSVIKY